LGRLSFNHLTSASITKNATDPHFSFFVQLIIEKLNHSVVEIIPHWL
jgi:hypothetical protein